MRWGRFYGRRFMRLWPALAVMVTTVALFLVLLDHYGVARIGPPVLWGAGFAGNVDQALHHLIPADFTPLWSLGVEFQFYLAFPVLAAVLWKLRASGRTWFVTVAALAIASEVGRALTWNGPGSYPGPYVLPWTRVDGLLWGAALAIALDEGWVGARARRALAVLGPLAVAFMTWMALNAGFTDGWVYAWGMTATSIAATAVVGWLVTAPQTPAARLLATRIPARIGLWSYSLYLWHQPVFVFMDRHVRLVKRWPRAGLAIALMLAVGVLSYELVERPALRLADRVRRRREAGADLSPGSATAGGLGEPGPVLD